MASKLQNPLKSIKGEEEGKEGEETLPMSRIEDEENSTHRAFKVPPSREVKEKRKSASMGFEKSKIYEETSIGLSLGAMLDALVLDDID